jgi:lipoprotein-anchoring transpeptidase ErfK/SrfK
MPVRGSRSRLAVAAVAVLAVSVSLAGCQEDGKSTSGADDASSPSGGTASGDEEAAGAPAAVLHTNVSKGQSDVTVDTPVTVRVSDGSLESVAFKQQKHQQELTGSFNADKTVWTADGLLEPGTSYVVQASATNADGVQTNSQTKFSTEDLTLDQQTYASLTPLQSETVGVGMPVIVQFDIPVQRKAAFEQHMTVTAKPATVGSWNWISDTEVHWRPKTYWKSGTKVHVDVDVNSINAGNGIYGQMSRDIDFKIGQSVIMRADLSTDQMKVMIDGALARTIPITGGKPGFATRSGTKLIIEKFTEKRMDAATVGINPGDPEYYDIPDVEYAQRVTFSGEFLHAAPWSTYAQGSYNVSHGCVGMSTDNGAWLFSVTHRGDPVEVTGTNRGLEQGNGWTDWNESFADYKAGSALS